MGNKDNELYGLLNIALNPTYLNCIWQDLRLIYKIVSKNTDVIEFKTKVDLFSSCVKFITESSLPDQRGGQKEFKKEERMDEKNKKSKVINHQAVAQMIEKSMKALIYCLVHILKELMIKLKNKPKQNYEELRYFLSALSVASEGLGSNVDMIIRVPELFEFLQKILYESLSFEFLEPSYLDNLHRQD